MLHANKELILILEYYEMSEQAGGFRGAVMYMPVSCYLSAGEEAGVMLKTREAGVLLWGP